MLLPLAASGDDTPKPPTAKKLPKTDTLHGETRVDNYRWLRERNNPDVKAHLEAENAYAQKLLAHTKPFQEALYKEMLGRIKQTDLSVPYRKGGYWYYSRTEEGKQYQILCRKKGSLDASEQVTLDVNELAKGQRFMSVAAYQVSDSGKLLAYTTDNTGFRQYTLYVKDLESGKVMGPLAEKTGSVAWAADDQTLFYTVEDQAKRQYRLYRHKLGGPHELLYEEKDERFRVGVGRTRSQKYLLMRLGSLTASEWRYLDAATPAGEWKTISPRETDHEYDVEHHGANFYIRTNSGGRHFRLVSAPVADPGRKNWKEILRHREKVMLSGIDYFSGHAVLSEREDGLPHLRVMDLKSGASHRVQMPEPVYSVFGSANPEFETTEFRYSYQSFTTPSSVYAYDMATRKAALLKRTEVLGGFDSGQYQSERVYATAKDGTKIPISVVYRKGVKRDSKAPMLLYAYGSYGASMPVSFSSNRVSLLDRGVVYALAHIRGGGDLGKRWHDAGRMLNKKNTFTDFIASAEHLIAAKYTSSNSLVISGGSAGGLLMGAVVNMRPDLFKAVVSLVPFVDVINTMLDESLPLTVGEFEEWGNPKKKEEYDYIKTYCPYTNLDGRAYPAMLVRTSFDDSQVMYWEPAKYVAKLRTLKTDSNPLLFFTNMAGGHGGSSGRYDRLREDALDYAFMLWQMGIRK
ncbi:MAG: S9 family peptidase [Acidimicrobiia bacterium]|nr:S9 family peptidase [Acidimicrobiia bacterium]